MTPADAIADLDELLAEDGEDVTLSRPGGGLVDLICRALVRDYEPEELVGSIEQRDVQVTLSPTSLTGGWLQPVQGDRIRFDSRWHKVMNVSPTRMGGQVVRVELQARGI